MNPVLKAIKQKSKENDKVNPYISTDDILLIRAEFDEKEEFTLADIYIWLENKNIDVKLFNSLKIYLENETKSFSKETVLDEVTPLCLSIMDSLTKVEQHILYTLASGKLTNNSLSYYLTNKDLSKAIGEPSKTLAVYLKRLVEKGFLIIEDKSKKNFNYKIESKIFIDWFNFRYRLKPLKEKK